MRRFIAIVGLMVLVVGLAGCRSSTSHKCCPQPTVVQSAPVAPCPPPCPAPCPPAWPK